jgi:hypothetical protein
MGYTRIVQALGRIASTVFFCEILRNVFVKNLEIYLTCVFFFEEWGKIRHILEKLKNSENKISAF